MKPKKYGVKMGIPLFKIADLVQRHKIITLSSNYALYGDLSERVMSVLATMSPHQEIYSIDECFLDFSGFSNTIEHGRAYSTNHQAMAWVAGLCWHWSEQNPGKTKQSHRQETARNIMVSLTLQGLMTMNNSLMQKILWTKSGESGARCRIA